MAAIRAKQRGRRKENGSVCQSLVQLGLCEEQEPCHLIRRRVCSAICLQRVRDKAGDAVIVGAQALLAFISEYRILHAWLVSGMCSLRIVSELCPCYCIWSWIIIPILWAFHDMTTLRFVYCWGTFHCFPFLTFLREVAVNRPVHGHMVNMLISFSWGTTRDQAPEISAGHVSNFYSCSQKVSTTPLNTHNDHVHTSYSSSFTLHISPSALLRVEHWQEAVI